MATWPPPFLQGLQAATQPFFIQTPYGVCLYDPSTGACSPPINPAAFTATNMPPPPQQQLAVPPAAPPPPPPAAAAQPPPPAAAAQPPPPPSLPPAIDVSIEQSTFSPSSDMVKAGALDAMSKLAWRFRSDLRPMQVRINGTLHECPLSDGLVIAIDQPPLPPAPAPPSFNPSPIVCIWSEMLAPSAYRPHRHTMRTVSEPSPSRRDLGSDYRIFLVNSSTYYKDERRSERPFTICYQ